MDHSSLTRFSSTGGERNTIVSARPNQTPARFTVDNIFASLSKLRNKIPTTRLQKQGEDVAQMVESGRHLCPLTLLRLEGKHSV